LPVSRDDEFYVGYLPMPARQARFVKRLLAGLIPAVIAVGIIVTTQQRDPGDGVWEVGTSRQLVGLATASPYAALRFVDEAAGGTIRTLHLVSAGKFGATVRVRPFDGQAVRVTGTLLHREGRRLLELAEGEDALQPISLPPDQMAGLGRVEPVPLGPVTLRGEIIDPKCYVGAMKPGGGKTHKACAQLCVGGGIPPMFVTRDAGRREMFYLLVDADGGPANDLVLPYLGDPVELAGALTQRDDVLVIRIDPAGIRRL
jgi:hypothetical protein